MGWGVDGALVIVRLYGVKLFRYSYSARDSKFNCEVKLWCVPVCGRINDALEHDRDKAQTFKDNTPPPVDKLIKGGTIE